MQLYSQVLGLGHLRSYLIVFKYIGIFISCVYRSMKPLELNSINKSY